MPMRRAMQRALTRALKEASEGSAQSADELFAACYTELRRVAHKYLRGERRDHSLQTTELVHESYIRLVDASQLTLRNRSHFFAIAARVMRRILVDHARSRRCAKRSGRFKRVDLDQASIAGADLHNLDFLALDLALSRLSQERPEAAQAIEMRFFGGMTYEEISQCLDVSLRTVKRYADYARARLYELLTESTEQTRSLPKKTHSTES